MHPDERNMANAALSLHCKLSTLSECFNPHFFAYGQFPLYMGYLFVKIWHFLSGNFGLTILFSEAALALRLISAVSSILTALIIYKIIQLVQSKQSNNFFHYIFTWLIIIFTPCFIQFSHFGTTESLLMLFNSLLVYMCLIYLNNKINRNIFLAGVSIFSGLALATKVSSFIFILVPLIILILKDRKKHFLFTIRLIFLMTFSTLIVFVIFSPHNFISFPEFISSMKYEADVALGTYVAFYTRQFINTTPYIFQLYNVFPYMLGMPLFILSILGMIFLPYNKEHNMLRLTVLIFMLSQVEMFVKWSRFMAPILPIMVVFAIFFVKHIYVKIKFKFKNILLAFIIIICIIPGIAYLSIYENNDVRYTATQWINKNIPQNLFILSETANVVDIPIYSNNFYKIISFNFYDVDSDPQLQKELLIDIEKADYIFVPSRRIFMNHTCERNDKFLLQGKQNSKQRCEKLQKKYPILNEYYKKLFNGSLGFKQVAEFSSYPKISLFGKTIFEFSDESSEETWTVFDHPVIRIYKRN
ncbi:MAG: glycosyltransferase family 39 protein [bacterium]|nr:glycosyltransferase family 39 protein [bacterium]